MTYECTGGNLIKEISIMGVRRGGQEGALDPPGWPKKPTDAHDFD